MINNHVHTRTHTPLCACANVCNQLGSSRYSNIVTWQFVHRMCAANIVTYCFLFFIHFRLLHFKYLRSCCYMRVYGAGSCVLVGCNIENIIKQHICGMTQRLWQSLQFWALQATNSPKQKTSNHATWNNYTNLKPNVLVIVALWSLLQQFHSKSKLPPRNKSHMSETLCNHSMSVNNKIQIFIFRHSRMTICRQDVWNKFCSQCCSDLLHIKVMMLSHVGLLCWKLHNGCSECWYNIEQSIILGKPFSLGPLLLW